MRWKIGFASKAVNELLPMRGGIRNTSRNGDPTSATNHGHKTVNRPLRRKSVVKGNGCRTVANGARKNPRNLPQPRRHDHSERYASRTPLAPTQRRI